MALRILTGIISPTVFTGSATIHFNPHTVTGNGVGIELSAVGPTNNFTSPPAKVVALRKMAVVDKDTAVGGTELDQFMISDTLTATDLVVNWLSSGGSRIQEISYMVAGDVDVRVPSPDTVCVNTIAELRALTSISVMCATVLGYHGPGDGGGGQFYWDPLSPAKENGGTVIVPASKPRTGRWMRLIEEQLPAKAFGAIDDGNSHPLGSFFTTLADAQAVYPHGQALTDEISWVAIQAAIDYYIDHPTEYRAIYLHPGVYKLNRPLIIGRDSNFVRCHLVGMPNSTASGLPGPNLVFDSLTLPVLIIQGARGVSCTGINFFNGNKRPYEKFNTLQPGETIGQAFNRALFLESDPQTWLSTGARDNPYSPQAVVAIDPFMGPREIPDPRDPIQPYYPNGDPANAYPGYEEYYGGTTWRHPSASSGITFRQCWFQGGVVGVAISISGPAPAGTPEAGQDTIQNNENYVFEHCYWVYNKTHLASGQSQARGIKLDSPVMAGSHIAIDSEQYGMGGNPGQPPIITGAPVISGCRYFLNINHATQAFNIENAYFESTLSLGWIGHGSTGVDSPASFRGCTFIFYTPLPGTPGIPFHLRTFGPVEFQTCTFAVDTGVANPTKLLRVWNAEGRCFFNKCSILTGDRHNNVMIAFEAYDDRLQIEHAHTYHVASGARYEADPKPTITFVAVNNSNNVQVAMDGTPDKGIIAVSNTSGIQVGDVLGITGASPVQPERYPAWPTPNDFANAFPYTFLQPIGVIWDITPNSQIKVDSLPEQFPFTTDLHLRAIRWDNAS